MLATVLPVLAAASIAQAASIAKRADIIADYSSNPLTFAYPSPRAGFSAAEAADYPCGGRSATSSRQSFPLTGGQVVVDSDTIVSNVNLLWSPNAEPTTFHEFSTFANTILDMSTGTACMEGPDFSALGLSEGATPTLLAIYQLYGNSTYFYTCADVSLVAASSYTAPSYTCSNTSALFAVASDADSMVLAGSDYERAQGGVDGQTVALVAATAAAEAATVTVTPTSVAAASSNKDDGLSAAAGGGIGAGVTIAVFLALLALGAFTGFLRFGKKSTSKKEKRLGPRFHVAVPMEVACAISALVEVGELDGETAGVEELDEMDTKTTWTGYGWENSHKGKKGYKKWRELLDAVFSESQRYARMSPPKSLDPPCIVYRAKA
ncbi:hypothetical protein JCM6882_003636 [Rhodosporidiobolus microsporus]